MAEILFPEIFSTIEDVTIEETDDSFSGYKPSVYFDFSTGDFVRDGTNKLIESSGTDAWIQWCIKCLSTPRYNCLAYSTDFGIDYEAIFSSSSRAEAESNITREVEEALSADPYERLSYIESIVFDWEDDTTVNVTVTLVGVDGNTAVINTMLAA